MARTFTGDTLVIASHNPGKVREIGALLEPFGIHVQSAAELGLTDPEETGTTFAANAELKARTATEATGMITLADDSGLVVPALGGDPGIYSARWAGPDKDFKMAMTKVHEGLENLEPKADRAAYFVCALSLAGPDDHVETLEGRVDGTLVWPPRGELGFGYDPMFMPSGYDQTFGEINPDHKHTISHRADAFRKLIHACFDE